MLERVSWLTKVSESFLSVVGLQPTDSRSYLAKITLTIRPVLGVAVSKLVAQDIFGKITLYIRPTTVLWTLDL